MLTINRLGELFKKIKGNSNESKVKENTNIEKTDNIHIRIQIDGDTGLFKDEKQKIIERAKQLLELGKCDDMVDAIITCATLLRGLKFRKVKNDGKGEIIIVLKDTAQEFGKYFNRDEEDLR